MLKKLLMDEIKIENHYTVPKYLLVYAKSLGLDMNSCFLLIYFLNHKNKDLFDYKKIIKCLNFTEKDFLDAISLLKDKRLLAIQMEKNESGILEERVDISSFYEIIFSKMMEDEDNETDNSQMYDMFEREFGRTLSPMEYEIINGWLESNIKRELILAALKEAVFNGVSNLRYIDKILYEWNKRGIKSPDDILKKEKQEEDGKDSNCYEYDWLNEE